MSPKFVICCVKALILLILLCFAGCAGQPHDGGAQTGICWTKEKAQEWYAQQPWPIGFNYVPANAISYTEMWMPYAFDPKLIDKELALAEDIGFNCLRVVLPFVVWEHDPVEFKQMLHTFVDLCDKRHIKVMFALFDDCAFGSDEKLKNPWYGRQPDVVPGHYASGWTPSPGHEIVRDRQAWPRLKNYVQDVIGEFKDDERVWVWDLYNEPTNGGVGAISISLVDEVFEWARAAGPTQPLTVGDFDRNEELRAVIFANSDIITFHDYGGNEILRQHIEELRQFERPIINTEWLNRPFGSRVENDLPIFFEENVGCMLWGLVNGKTQTDLTWGHKPGDPEPEMWQHDLFHGDHTPYRAEEHNLFRAYIAKSRQ
jgi:hypothetical protein